MIPGPKAVGRSADRIFHAPTDTRSDRMFYEIKERTLRGATDVIYKKPHPSQTDCVLCFVEPILEEPGNERWWYCTSALADASIWHSHKNGEYRESVLFPKVFRLPHEYVCDEPCKTLYSGYEEDDAPGILRNKFKVVVHSYKDETVDHLGSWDDDLGLPVSVTKTLKAMPGVEAAGSAVFATVPAATETLKIAGTTITFVAGDPAANQISITGKTLPELVVELKMVVDGNHWNFPGGINEIGHGELIGSVILRIHAEECGTSGNALVLTDTSSSIITPGTLSGGVDNDTPAAVITESSQTIYNQISRWLMMETVTTPVAGANPSYNNKTYPSTMDVQIPAILLDVEFNTAWAYANKGGYGAYQEDIGVSYDKVDPSQESVDASTLRRIFATEVLATDYIATLGARFRFRPVTRQFTTASAYWFLGKNVFARANVQTFTTPSAIIQSDIVAAIPPGSGSVVVGDGGDNQPGSNVTISADGTTVPWGTSTLWKINTKQGRWGYWIVDAISITLPADPSPAP